MSSSPVPLQAEQHNIEIAGNSIAWKRKPLLQQIYHLFYRQIRSRLQYRVSGLTVELGSGQGHIKEVIPDCLTTDIFPNPWLDRVENAYALSFADGSVANMILFDVWHHLEFPGSALEEARRVLAPGARLILFEPAMGWLGLLAYGLFHHEPLGLKHRFQWRASEGVDLRKAPYFAAQASASRFFWKGKDRPFERDWRLVEVRPSASLFYVGSGGFSKWQFIPSFLFPMLVRLDPLFSRLPRLFATRMIVVLERRTEPFAP
jgi:SAM-dependent methyltransferase